LLAGKGHGGSLRTVANRIGGAAAGAPLGSAALVAAALLLVGAVALLAAAAIGMRSAALAVAAALRPERRRLAAVAEPRHRVAVAALPVAVPVAVAEALARRALPGRTREAAELAAGIGRFVHRERGNGTRLALGAFDPGQRGADQAAVDDSFIGRIAR